jgi:hypothetical protein
MTEMTRIELGVGTDLLLQAIDDYRFGGDQYDALPGDMNEDAQRSAYDGLVGKPMTVLEEWDRPAVTREGALAALRLARQELEEGGSEDIVRAMVSAALAFLEEGPRQQAADVRVSALSSLSR